MTTDLKKAANKNRAYYLSEQRADNNENKWFRYIKTMDSYSEPVLITPEMAQEVLHSNEFDLRKSVKTKQNTIVFSFSGKLVNGKGLLESIVFNNKSIVVFVSFNVSDKISFLLE